MNEEETQVRILVAANSKHGSTEEIGHHIAQALRSESIAVVEMRPDEVERLETFDAVVLGSAVYAGHWMKDAKALAATIGELETGPDVWLFSSGPLGDPPKPDEDPVDVADVMELTKARGHRVFSGKIDKSDLSFGEKAVMVAVRAPEGDFRPWEEITSWARSIAKTVERKVTST